MKLPKLPVRRGAIQRQIVTFGGVNYGEGAGEGELAESVGLSCGKFPCLSQRGGRELVRKCSEPNAVFAWGKLCVVDGTSLLYDGEQVGTVTNGPKEMAVVNTKLCIFPDKKYLDLTSKKFGSLGAELQAVQGTVTFTENSLTMQVSPVVETSQARYGLKPWEEDDPYPFIMRYDSVSWSESGGWVKVGGREVGIIWLEEGDVLILAKSTIHGTGGFNIRWPGQEDFLHYGEYNDEGYYGVVTAVDGEIKVGEPGYQYVTYETYCYGNRNGKFTEFFSAGDVATLSGCRIGANNKDSFVVAVDDYKLTFQDGSMTAGTDGGAVKVERRVPALKYICECNNRLWGCEGHTIWASALGDPKNFYRLQNDANDSYAVAVGTDGEFTGCTPYSGNVLFWKERCLHKVMGDLPKEYAIAVYNIEGVQAGSHRSLEIINEVLYYKGRTGIYAYTGGTPALVSTALGQRRFENAAAGTDGVRYYISMRDTSEEDGWGLYVYDTQNRLWLREDNTRAVDFTNLDGVLHVLDAEKKTVWAADRPCDEQVEWMAEFAPFTDEMPERKRHLRLLLRLELEAGATVQTETREDMGPWRRVWSTGNARAGTFAIPLSPRRCDRFSLRLSGKGGCLVRSLTREFQIGSWV